MQAAYDLAEAMMGAGKIRVQRYRPAPAAKRARFREEVEPTVRIKVRIKVRGKVRGFQEAGLGGIDLYLACFGQALEVVSKSWPLTRGTTCSAGGTLTG